MSGRPLDVLEASVGETVTVRLKGGITYRGEFAGYDQHMNLVLKPTGDEPVDVEVGEAGVESVRDTTIIRGDNLVSITP